MAAAEDFAYFLRQAPGAFAFVGAGNVARGIVAPHHASRFDIDESALPIGAELLVRIALGNRGHSPFSYNSGQVPGSRYLSPKL